MAIDTCARAVERAAPKSTPSSNGAERDGRARPQRQSREGSASGAFVWTACRLRVGCKEVRLMGQHDCLDAVTEVELLEDVRDVRLDRGVADVELLADLRVGE